TVVDCTRLGNSSVGDLPPVRPGGTAILAATALRDAGFAVCVVGRVGDDTAGRRCLEIIQEMGAENAVTTVPSCSTSRCLIVYTEAGNRWMLVDAIGSNDYDLISISGSLDQIRPTAADVILVFLHAASRQGPEHTANLLRRVYETKARVVIDVVPHDLW